MNLEIKKIDNIIEVFLTGRLDVLNSIIIEEKIHELVKSEPGYHILLNLNDIKYMSSSGIRIFVSTMRLLKESGKSLKLCNLNDSVRKIFEVVELLDMFEVHNTEEEALKSF